MDFLAEVREYLEINGETVLDSLLQHIWLALVPVAIAFVLSLPLGWMVVQFRLGAPPDADRLERRLHDPVAGPAAPAARA